MATKTADLHIRIQPEIKARAEDIFASSGHTMSDAVEQFLTWTVKHNKPPVRLRRHRARIPDLNSMTKLEINQLLHESETEADNGMKKGTLQDVSEIKERMEKMVAISDKDYKFSRK